LAGPIASPPVFLVVTESMATCALKNKGKENAINKNKILFIKKL
jgi:hypothetical protein